MFYGYLDFPWWGYVAYTLIVTHITIAAVTIFLHRCQAHRALTLHPVVSHFFRFWLWLTTGMETKAWASLHRKHHAKCETEDDPHSPIMLGLPMVLWRGAELYRAGKAVPGVLERYGKGTPDDWLERNIYTKCSAYGLLIMLFVNIVLLGVPGITIWAIQMAWIPFFAAGIINGVGHFWGYRNFECPDASTNIVPWGILIGGEELHNNHHTYPTSAKFSIKWWEFDLCWGYIRALSFFGLATIKRVPPKTKILTEKKIIDGETLRAIITNRFQVLAQYSQSVMLPVLRQGVWSRGKVALLKRSEALINAVEQKKLDHLLEENPNLQVVYQFRKQLQQIWSRTTATQKELIEALHDWCQRAEETGIEYLQKFVAYLRGYSTIVSV